MKRSRFLFQVLCCWIGCLSLAEAHAFLDTAEPAVGSTLKIAPTVVKIWFTRSLRANESKIAVFDARQKEMESGPAKLDSTDATLLIVTVPKLAPGVYQVKWTAVCLDTHTTHGDFSFTVTP